MGSIKSLRGASGKDKSDITIQEKVEDIWLCKELNAKVFIRKPSKGGSFPASIVGRECDRYLYLYYNGKLPEEQVTFTSRRMMEHGHSAEDRFAKYFTEMRILVGREVSTKYASPPISGRIDFILTLPELQLSKCFLELKTIGSKDFKKLTSPKIEHELQLQSYLNMCSVPVGIVLYECRDSMALKGFQLERDEQKWKEIIERCQYIQSLKEMPSISLKNHPSYCSCLLVD